ncbi:hypothetical protein COHA_007315 [Chlorella ohadii]|uniref:Uncharacterized protein n=1 Tax=Chlorella ohadii TaxID=2649997 RepID=A0AAD5H009_9CHLO|nr:hypothetical protein COHA_007315 [Chlorella ohadii]
MVRSGRRHLPLVALLALLGTDMAAAAPNLCVANQNGVWSDQEELDRVGACKVCSADGTRCEQCWEFFSMNSSGDCVPCKATEYGEGTGAALTCISCKADDPSHCYNCGGRFLLREEPDDFQGFYADANGKCIQCPTPHCAECQNVTGVCLQCEPGYGLVGFFFDPAAAACTPCKAGCARCESADECSGCDYGYLPDPATGQCAPCPSNCQECSAANQCSQCKSGHTNVTTDGSACAACADPLCSFCAEGVDKCTSCSENGFGPDPATKRCVACTTPNCSSCSDSAATCTECGPGYVLDGATGACEPCKVQNCSWCRISSQTGQEECESCLNGYTSSVANADPITACVPGSA